MLMTPRVSRRWLPRTISGDQATLSLARSSLSARVAGWLSARLAGARGDLPHLWDVSPAGQLVAAENGMVLFCNREAGRVLGRGRREIVGLRLSELLPDLDGRLGDFSAWASSAQEWLPQVQVPLCRPDGMRRILCVTAARISTPHRGLRQILALSDVTDQVQAQRQIETIAERASYLATHDVLTSLPNRALFLRELEDAVVAAEHDGARFALVFIDLDNFKQVNDSLGHRVGDQLLKAVAQRLQGRTGPGEVLARLGGDEFILRLSTENRHDALERANQIRALFDTPFSLEGNSIYATGSFGLTLYPDHDLKASGLMQSADLAMYEAKAEGKNQVRMFDEELRRAAARRSEVHQALRRALSGPGFSLALQPKLSIAGRLELAGVEALLRWTDPVLGQVSPAEFIPIAETSGLIGAIDLMVASMVGELARAWDRRGIRLPISLNVSAASLYGITAEACLATTLQTVGLPPGRVTLEITESTLMRNVASARDHLARLVAAGYRIAIDDFGTGYSSLSYLQGLPIQEVKIDRSFVSALGGPQDGRSTAVVESVLAIARALGLGAVAEGVENGEQLAWLQAHGCSQAQGFMFGRPIPVEEFEAHHLQAGVQTAG